MTFILSQPAVYTLLLLSPPCFYVIWNLWRPVPRKSRRIKGSFESDDPLATDPSLLRKHTTYETIKVPATGFTYPELRIFHCPHPQTAKLPQLPLLVFIHGLGGSVAQFHPLLSSLVNLAPCLAIDLPGCGISDFAPKYWDAYRTSSLVHLLAVVISKHLDDGQEVVLICHSMGCSLGALLVSNDSPYRSELSSRIKGLVALCPAAKQLARNQIERLQTLLTVAIDPVFDLWRAWDRRGGTEGGSILRFTGPNAEPQLKRLQLRFNTQSRTPVFRRMAYGTLPKYNKAGIPHDGIFFGKEMWAGIQVPVLIIGGEDDPVTTAAEAVTIASYLGHTGTPDDYHGHASLRPSTMQQPASSVRPVTPSGTQAPSKLVILPSPASHALLYSPLTVRPVSSLIQNFLSTYVAQELSLGWQLQYLTTEGKWDVKNLEKWEAVEPLSRPIASVFRAMKTLREVDERHSPQAFVKSWTPSEGVGTGLDGQGPVGAVVDISHDSPVYDPKGLEDGGIIYRKFPTVSKMPPTQDEVRGFIDLIDHLRDELNLPSSEPSTAVANNNAPSPMLIAVHCHYGFNRTGFFLVSYMVERLGWPLKDALEEFAEIRPPGVRHSHFVDELWGRYWDISDERARS